MKGKKGRNPGILRSTALAESAYYAVYLQLRKKGYKHRDAVEALADDFLHHLKECPFFRYTFKIFSKAANLGASRINQIVTKKNKVIKDLRRQHSLNMAIIRNL